MPSKQEDAQTFIKITNREIYDSLQQLHIKVDKIDSRGRLHQVLIGGAFTLIAALSGFLWKHATETAHSLK